MAKKYCVKYPELIKKKAIKLLKLQWVGKQRKRSIEDNLSFEASSRQKASDLQRLKGQKRLTIRGSTVKMGESCRGRLLVMQERLGRVWSWNGVFENVVFQRGIEVATTVVPAQSSAKWKSPVTRGRSVASVKATAATAMKILVFKFISSTR